jgi:hypothetical protein
VENNIKQQGFSWRKGVFLSLIIIGLVLFVGCAAGPNTMMGSVAEGATEPAGFFSGLWHGMISFIALIISFFNNNVNVYEVHNTGWPYNIGFILGVMLAYGGGAGGASYRRNKDRD